MKIQRGGFERTSNHWWWRDGWEQGSRYYTFHLTFEAEPALAGEAGRYAPSLGDIRGVDLVPGRWLHLTMTGVGSTQSIRVETLSRLTMEVFGAAAELEFEPILFDTLFIYGEGVALSAEPAPWLGELKSLQEEAVSGIRSDENAASDEFHPHVSLAYFSDEVDEAALTTVLREAKPRELTVARPTLSLIELGRDHRVYTWRVVDALPLGEDLV